MSNFNFTPEEMAKISQQIEKMCMNDARLSFFTYAEKMDKRAYNIDYNDWEVRQQYIRLFVQRMSFYNQLTTLYSYADQTNNQSILKWISDETWEKVSHSPDWSLVELIEKLESLHYNCISNGGAYMVSKMDDEKYEHLLGQLYYLLKEQYKKLKEIA